MRQRGPPRNRPLFIFVAPARQYPRYDSRDYLSPQSIIEKISMYKECLSHLSFLYI